MSFENPGIVRGFFIFYQIFEGELITQNQSARFMLDLPVAGTSMITHIKLLIMEW